MKTQTGDPAELRFGKRLRLERERRRITLDSIAANTKIGLALLKGLERDDVSRWPSGLYRRSFIREYAAAIGLDPDDTAREFLERFPDPGEPSPRPAVVRSSEDPVLRLTLADTGASFTRGWVLADSWRRWAAIGWDLAACFVVGGVLFLALDQWWKPLAVTTIGYYAVGVLLLGNTPGVFFFGRFPTREPQRGDTASGPPLRQAAPRIPPDLLFARIEAGATYGSSPETPLPGKQITSSTH